MIVVEDIYKLFGGIRAVDHVTINLYPGEVVGVLGHNGAGKSVLMKMLSGALPRDSGEIYVDGERAEINNPRDARRRGKGVCEPSGRQRGERHSFRSQRCH